MAITEEQRHESFTTAEEVLGADQAETLMSLLPPVGWADVATKQDLAGLEERMATRLESTVNGLRAEFQRDLRQQLVTVLTGNAVLLGLFTALS